MCTHLENIIAHFEASCVHQTPQQVYQEQNRNIVGQVNYELSQFEGNINNGDRQDIKVYQHTMKEIKK